MTRLETAIHRHMLAAEQRGDMEEAKLFMAELIAEHERIAPILRCHAAVRIAQAEAERESERQPARESELMAVLRNYRAAWELAEREYESG